MPGVAFTAAQTTILSDAIQNYQQITGKDRVAEKEKLIADLALQVSTADEHEDEEGMRKIRASVKNWLSANAREPRNEAEFFKKISWYSVFVDKMAEEIRSATAELTDSRPGSKEYIAYHRKAATELARQLTQDEMIEYEQIAEDWNGQGAPSKVQQKQVFQLRMMQELISQCRERSRHLSQFFKQLSLTLWRRFGIRMLMFWGCEDEDGKVYQSFVDHNEKHGDANKFAELSPGELKGMNDEWGKYLARIYNNEGGVGMERPSAPSITIGDKGQPLLPDVDFAEMKLSDMKTLLREYLTKCFQRSTGNRKAKIPWGRLQLEPDNFIDSAAEYLPPGITLVDPSHLRQIPLTQILEHLKDRQDDDSVDVVFEFKAGCSSIEDRPLPPAARRNRSLSHSPILHSPNGHRGVTTQSTTASSSPADDELPCKAPSRSRSRVTSSSTPSRSESSPQDGLPNEELPRRARSRSRSKFPSSSTPSRSESSPKDGLPDDELPRRAPSRSRVRFLSPTSPLDNSPVPQEQFLERQTTASSKVGPPRGAKKLKDAASHQSSESSPICDELPRRTVSPSRSRSSPTKRATHPTTEVAPQDSLTVPRHPSPQINTLANTCKVGPPRGAKKLKPAASSATAPHRQDLSFTFQDSSRRREFRRGSAGSPSYSNVDIDSQMAFLATLSEFDEYRRLVAALRLVPIRNEDTDDVLCIPGGITWEYDFYSLPAGSHTWTEKHEYLFSTDIFGIQGDRRGRDQLTQVTLFTGLLLRDKDLVSGKRSTMSVYPTVSEELRNTVIGEDYIQDSIIPWCLRIEQQIRDANVKKINQRPSRAPLHCHTFDDTLDFLSSLSREGRYRQLVLSLENLKGGSNTVDGSLPSYFSAKYALHHVGSDAHLQWKKWGSKAQVRLDVKGRRHSLGYMVVHVMFFGMIMRDLEIRNSGKVTCAYPHIPSYLAESQVTPKDIESILSWCSNMAKAIGNQDGDVGPVKAAKRSMACADDVPAAKRSRVDMDEVVKERPPPRINRAVVEITAKKSMRKR